HTELHRARPDARVVVHNHPYHVTVLAGIGVLPELVNQTGAMFHGDLRFVEEYGGEVDSPALGAELAEQIGDAAVAILASHGVIVTGATIEGRVPKRFADRAPRVVDRDDGSQTWVYDGVEMPNIGFNAVVGRPVSEYSFEPVRFDDMRRGAWDIHARVADMDLNGVWASL